MRTQRTSYQSKFHVIQDRFSQIREMVELQMRGSALKLVDGLFREEVDRLCGRRFSRKAEDLCHRGGSDPGSVIVRGQRVSIRKPRMKRDGQEVSLESYQALQGFDLLCERVMKHMLCGVSTRNYEGLLDELEGSLGLKRSSVSRAFVQGSQQALDEINSRDLLKDEWLAMFIDGIEFADRTVIVAMGLTVGGHKHILGLREGDTENAEVCKDLLQSLIERGLPPDALILFVIDGSKALRKAIRKVFGDRCPVQRCIRHKERNVLSYLPKHHHMEFRRRWKRLHAMATETEARKEYDRLVYWLGTLNDEALRSLEEAEEETMTVLRLKTPAKLKRTLLSTNPIESVFDQVRSKSNRVKNWKSGPNQVPRWTASALLTAEKRFRRIQGYREIPLLLTEIKTLSLQNERKVA